MASWLGLTSRRQQQAIGWGAALEDLAGLDGPELRRVVEDNPAVAELVGLAWEEAARTASDDKRHLLAQVAASALRGETVPEKVDRLQFLLRPVIALDPPHITLLVLMGRVLETMDQTERWDRGQWQVQFIEIADAWPGGVGLLSPALSALEGQGLVGKTSDGNWFELLPFSREFLDYLLIDAGGWPPYRDLWAPEPR